MARAGTGIGRRSTTGLGFELVRELIQLIEIDTRTESEGVRNRLGARG